MSHELTKVSFKLNDSTPKQSIKIKNGETLLVQLEAQLGTGYSWKLSNINEACLQKTTLTDQAKKSLEPKKLGSSELQAFTFETLKPCKTTIQFKYLRPWEQPEAPLKTYELFLEIY